MSEMPIDLAVYIELKSTTGSEFVVELVRTFLDEAPVMLADLHKARGESNSDNFRRAAHSLKSNANTFGAKPLAALARELELADLDADPGQDAATLTALEAEYARAAAALKVLCNG